MVCCTTAFFFCRRTADCALIKLQMSVAISCTSNRYKGNTRNNHNPSQGDRISQRPEQSHADRITTWCCTISHLNTHSLCWAMRWNTISPLAASTAGWKIDLIWSRWSMRMVFFAQVEESFSLLVPVPKRKTDLLPPRTITAAKIVPAANSEASVSNPPTRWKTKRSECVQNLPNTEKSLLKTFFLSEERFCGWIVPLKKKKRISILKRDPGFYEETA